MQSINLLGVKIDKVTQDQAIDQIARWINGKGKRYVVTPNVEFLMAAQKDLEFKRILNQADLSIPDSANLGWGYEQLKAKNILRKLLHAPLFIFPKTSFLREFPITTGVDLMAALIAVSEERGFTIGLLGGKNQVAEKLAECLGAQYPRLKLNYVNSSVNVDFEGNVIGYQNNSNYITNGEYDKTHSKNDTIKVKQSRSKSSHEKGLELEIPPLDILFVAFGQVKQEKWIAAHLPQQQVKVMMGVGGAFDYLSGNVPRAPKWVRSLGFEWLFRLIVQPWRIKRFGALVKYVWIVLTS